MSNPTLLFHVFDTLKRDLRHLHPTDRLSASARMIGRPSLVADNGYRSSFALWRRGVAL